MAYVSANTSVGASAPLLPPSLRDAEEDAPSQWRARSADCMASGVCRASLTADGFAMRQ